MTTSCVKYAIKLMRITHLICHCCTFTFLQHVSIACYAERCISYAKMTPATIVQSSLEDSPMTLVPWRSTSARNSKGNNRSPRHPSWWGGGSLPLPKNQPPLSALRASNVGPTGLALPSPHILNHGHAHGAPKLLLNRDPPEPCYATGYSIYGDWTFRSQDISFPGTKHKFWTFRSLDVSFLGQFVPWTFRSKDDSFPYLAR